MDCFRCSVWLVGLIFVLEVSQCMGSDCQPPITFGEFEDHKAFPPKELVGGDRRSELKEWFEENVPVLRQQTGLTKREKEMILWTAGEYIENRRSSLVTCEEYASTLVKRMMFYEEACIFTTTTYRLSERIVEMAREMDQKAQEEGVEAIAPLYGFPIPLKVWIFLFLVFSVFLLDSLFFFVFLSLSQYREQWLQLISLQTQDRKSFPLTMQSKMQEWSNFSKTQMASQWENQLSLNLLDLG